MDTAVDIEQLRATHWPEYTHTFTERDVALYALGLGRTPSNGGLRDVYERHQRFSTLPTYAIVAAHPATWGLAKALEARIPGFTRVKALHGEQYLWLHAPLPTHGQLITRPQLVDVRDKGRGKGVVLVVRGVTTDAALGHIVAETEFIVYGLGAGGFGSPWPPAPRPAAATVANQPPARAPDAEADLATSRDQAALYRLSGDLNPLHIDPDVARRVGYTEPILHGLATLGMSVNAVVDALVGGDAARVRSVKARFSKHVFPGDTLRVRMWRVEPLPQSTLQRAVFETSVPGRGSVVVVSSAAVEFADTPLVLQQPPSPASRL